MDYLFFVVAFNRGIRRYVDYENEFFNRFSTISLTPIIVGGLAALIVFLALGRNDERFGNRSKTVLGLYSCAVGYAFAIGFVNAKFAAIYALGDYIAPIGLMGFGILWADDQQTISRWCNTFALTAFLVAIYGLWQFYTIPPWDGFWLVESEMDGYMGFPEPRKMTLFSTMAARGPAAMYLCAGLMVLALRPKTLIFLRIPAIVTVCWAMLLTYARTSVIFSGLAVLLFPILNRGSGAVTVGLIILAALFVGPIVMGGLPDQAYARVETIGSISEDASFNGRIRLLGIALSRSLSSPQGLGIGAGGMASRVENATTSTVGDSTGYAETLATYGFIGFLVIISVLYRIWNSSSVLVSDGLDDENIRIFRAWLIAGMAALFSANWLAGASFFWVLAGYSLGRLDDFESYLDDPEEEFDPDDEFQPGEEFGLSARETALG